MAETTEIDALIGVLRALDQWRSAEVTVSGSGAHRMRNGSMYLQVDFLVEVIVPNHEQTKRLLAMIEGKDVAPIEARAVEGAEPLRLFGSEASETQADDPGAGSSES